MIRPAAVCGLHKVACFFQQGISASWCLYDVLYNGTYSMVQTEVQKTGLQENVSRIHMTLGTLTLLRSSGGLFENSVVSFSVDTTHIGCEPFIEFCCIYRINAAGFHRFKQIDPVLELTLVVQSTFGPCTASTIFSHPQQSAYQLSHVVALLINSGVFMQHYKVLPSVTLLSAPPVACYSCIQHTRTYCSCQTVCCFAVILFTNILSRHFIFTILQKDEWGLFVLKCSFLYLWGVWMCFHSCACVNTEQNAQLCHIWSCVSVTVARLTTYLITCLFADSHPWKRWFFLLLLLWFHRLQWVFMKSENGSYCFGEVMFRVLSLTDPSASQMNSEEKLNHEAQELEKRLSMLSHRSSTGTVC